MIRTLYRPDGWLSVLAVLLAGCGGSANPPFYQNEFGFRFTPPPEWVERARDDALPKKAAQRKQDLPLPPLGVSGSPVQERLLVRYDRLTAGYLAWLRVTVSDLPSSTAIKDCVSARSPGPGWKRESEVETLDVNGMSAVRVAFLGRWNDQEYVSETVALGHGEQVYLITASFPASDSTAREQVRQAVSRATWKQ